MTNRSPPKNSWLDVTAGLDGACGESYGRGGKFKNMSPTSMFCSTLRDSCEVRTACAGFMAGCPFHVAGSVGGALRILGASSIPTGAPEPLDGSRVRGPELRIGGPELRTADLRSSWLTVGPLGIPVNLSVRGADDGRLRISEKSPSIGGLIRERIGFSNDDWLRITVVGVGIRQG